MKTALHIALLVLVAGAINKFVVRPALAKALPAAKAA